MGAFLDKPKTEKTNHTGEGNGFKFAVASMQGWRIDMEDAHHVEVNLMNDPPFDKWSFFAVFDGHAGSRVAEHSAENLLHTILDTDEFQQLANILAENNGQITEDVLYLVKDGLRTGFLRLDAAMRSFHRDEQERSGTTAICAILTPEYVFVANLGDSRGILSRINNELFSTEDHKPYIEKERERILKAGGTVMIQRVNGSLAVSRALGDFEYKNVRGLPPTEQLVSPEPDVYILKRDKANDEFLVLACDGIYDVLENMQLCELVRSRLEYAEELTEATNQVLDVCLSMGSRDNMTMILVALEAAPKFNPEAREAQKAWLEQAAEKIDEILIQLEPAQREPDKVMSLLRSSTDIGELNVPGGYHLMRSLIDEKLKKYDSVDSDGQVDVVSSESEAGGGSSTGGGNGSRHTGTVHVTIDSPEEEA